RSIVVPVELRTHACFEQHLRNSRVETSSGGTDLDGHQLTTGKVEQLLAVSSPSPADTTIDRDLPFPRGARSGGKRLYVDLIVAALVGLVGYPLPIRRKACETLLSGCPHDRKRLTVPVQWQNPDVAFRLGVVYGVCQESAVLGPVAEEKATTLD